MGIFDKAWMFAIAKRKCSFCDNPALEYYKGKFYCQIHWDRLQKEKNSGTT